MIKLVVAAMVVTPLALLSAPGASADAGPAHTLQVSGTGVGMYPAYDPSVRRYAATTTEATFPSDAVDNTTNQGASVTVQATTSDPAGQVLVNGVPVKGGQTTTLPSLDAGSEISVVYVDSRGREADSIYLLPADFPTLTATTNQPGVTPGDVGLTLGQWLNNGWPNFEAVVDPHGVPVWTRSSRAGGLDLKLQPNGHYSESRGPAATGQILGSTQVVELDDRFQPMASFHTEGTLTSTDGHDSILEKDGSRVLLAYEPDATTGKTDSVIQEVDPQGQVTFQWDSSALAGETVIAAPAKDYAHINSVQIVNGGEDFLASFRNLSAVIEVARLPHDGYQPGDIVWKLGGRDSTFSFVDDPDNGPCGSALRDAAAQRRHHGVRRRVDQRVRRPVRGPERPHRTGTGATTLAARRVAPRPPGRHGHVGALLRPERLLRLVHGLRPAAPRDRQRPHRLGVGHPGAGHRAGSGQHSRLAAHCGAEQQRSHLLLLPLAQVRRSRHNRPGGDGDRPGRGRDVPLTAKRPHCGLSPARTRAARPCRPAATSRRERQLDTTTGAHTFTVTAADGAGNTTTVTRHYTVEQPSAVYRPDASVRRVDGTWLGNGVYGTPAGQTARRTVHVGGSTTVPFRMTNRGNRDDRCRVIGSHGSRRARPCPTGPAPATSPPRSWPAPGAPRCYPRTPERRCGRGSHVSPTARRGAVRTLVVTCTSTHLSSAHDAAGVRVTVG